jgi:DNA-binding beta-propeller fold protein YncE
MLKRTFSLSALAILVVLPVNLAIAGVTASFRYSLSNFSGPVRTNWTKLAVDPERNEIYALDQRTNDIRIFDENGMEIFVFGEGFSFAADIAIGNDGSIFLLSTGRNASHVDLLNYRGEHVAEIPLKDVPEKYANFAADRLIYRQGLLYLVDSNGLLVLIVDEAGHFAKAYELGRSLRSFMPRKVREGKSLKNYDWAQKKVEAISINGFSVDSDGNMLFTVPSIFGAFRMSRDGELVKFGRAGSGRGKFGVTAGITTDDLGYVYVSDRLRSVVLIFDHDLRFQHEFGYRGIQPSNLIVPDDLAIDRSGNLYVGQSANRGVSVFRVVHENISPSQGSTGSEKSDQVIEEDESDHTEFIVDHGGDATAADDSEVPGWAIEDNESNE